MRFSKFIPIFLGLILLALFSAPSLTPTPAYAHHCITCAADDCSKTAAKIISDHEQGRRVIKTHMALAFRLHQQWWYDKFWRQVLLPAMMQMANQLTSVGIYQMMGIGMQFDAKEQLEAQLLLQKMNVQAQKDYTPSSDFCAVGTNTRSLAASMEKSRHNTMALNAMALERHLGTRGSISAEQDNDKRARWQQFAEKYCNEKDNAYQTPQKSDPQPSGLQGVCGQIEDKNRTNLDVDYRRQIEEPLTIMADFTDAAVDAPEEDLVALARNLYGHNTLLRNTPNLNKISGARKYLTLRSVAAKRAVAENSFYNIAGLKMAGSDPANPENRKKTKETMAAVLKQLGMPEDEIEPFIGKNPSVYAQLEILAKKIFQSTGFFASLYDKPANVERRKVAMAAIGLMVDRAIYESRLRQEMLASVLISARLQPEFDRIQENMVATRSQE